MSFIKTAVAAGGMSLAMLTGALAQGGLEAWDIRERSAYIVMMDGKMMRMSVGDKGMTMLMRNARKVPHGTVFVMSGGQLYMVNAAKMFDRAGMPSFGGL
jgi:SOS-response transcriptional repressor LexA